MMEFLCLFGGDLLELVYCIGQLWRWDRDERARMRPAPIRVRR
jgi:hypothetical protein